MRRTHQGWESDMLSNILFDAASKAATVSQKHNSSVIPSLLLKGALRSTTATSTKTSPSNITLHYYIKSFEIISTCSRHIFVSEVS